jgi:hypothetical protein
MIINRLLSKKIAAVMLMIVILFSITLQTATANSNPQLWRVYAPQGTGFRVQLPGQPLKKVTGASTQYSYVEQTPRGKVFYGVAYEDFTSVPTDAEGILRAQCNGFAKGFEGQVVNWSTMTKHGLKGLVARVENRNSTAIVAAWVVNRRAYCIAFATHKTQNLPDEARQFIESLAFAR